MAHKWDPRCTPPRDLVAPVRIDPTGRTGPTRGQAAGPRWRRTGRDLQVPAHVDPQRVEQRILEASACLPAIGAVTGWAACRMHGAAFHDGFEVDGRTARPVPLALGSRGWRRPPQGAVLSFAGPAPVRWQTICGVRVVDVVRATFDAMVAAPDVREAVVELEKCVMAEIVSIEQVRDYAASRRGSHGIQKVRDAVALARENARSPQETRTRLIATVDAGITPLLVNAVIFDDRGVKVGEVDLLDPETGCVFEYDGDDHEGTPRRHRDAVKDARLRAIGLEVLRVTPGQMADRATLAQRMLETRSRALEIPPERRRYRVVPKREDLHARLQAARELAAYLEAVTSAPCPPASPGTPTPAPTPAPGPPLPISTQVQDADFLRTDR